MRHLLVLAALLSATVLCAQFSTQRLIDHTAVERPYDVDLADVDGDGDVDVVPITLGYDGGPVWFPNRGDGTFAPRRVVGYAGSYSVMELADLEQDGDLDIVSISSSPGEVDWFANDGAGNFGPVQVISTLASEGKDVHVADVDGDGDLDVLSASYGNGLVAWYANDGNGVFGAQQTIAAVAGAYTVRTGDLDGDGDLDVAAGGQGAASQNWYRNNGSGTFTAVAVADPGFGQWGTVLVEDVNDDTFLDIVGQSTGAGWTRWYANDGTGQFAAGITMMTGSQPVNMAIRDLDGDTDPDLMTCDGLNLRWWANDGAGTFTLGGVLVNGYDAWAVDAADLNGDAIIDVVGAYYDDSHVTVNLGLGAGVFDTFRFIAAPVDDIRTVLAADLDGDGRNDVVEAVANENKLAWFRNAGDNTFDPERVVSTLAYGISCARAGDLDGDGDVDLIGQNNGSHHITWTANDVAGNFGALQPISTGLNYGTVLELADMDGDDDLDVLGSDAAYAFTLFTNDGSGVFDAGTTIASAAPAVMATGDLDGDGDLDVLSGTGVVNVYRNEGGGVFTNTLSVSVSPNTVRAIAAVDMDDDGDLDLSYYIGNALFWRRNDGSGTFDTELLLANAGADANTYTATDVDGDGRTDLVSTTPTEVLWMHNLGSGQFAQPALITTVAGATSALGMGDLDSDGDPDVFTGSATEGKLAWHENYFLSAQRFEGTVFFDTNGDGVHTPDEAGVEGLPVHVTPGIPGLFSLANGTYAAHVEAGTYTLTTNNDPALWTVTTPDPRTVEITEAIPVLTGIDVGVSALVDTTILIPSITLTPALCGANTTLWLSVANAGTRVEQCEFTVELDPLFTFVSSTPPPTSILGNTLVWSAETLPYFSTITIPVIVTMPAASQLGDVYLLDLSVTNYDAENNPIDIYFSKLQDTLACSYDPNDKLVDPKGYGIYGAVEISSDTLDYTVRFQNTGNAPATTVMLRDQLDPILDPERIQLLGHSHPITLLRVEADGELVVRFDDIQLPGIETDSTGSQGFVRFRIKPMENAVQHLSTAHNTAGIYFDLNEPVITNTTLTTWVDCGLWQPEIVLYGVDSLVAEEGDAYQWYRDDEAVIDATGANYHPTSSGTYAADVTSGFGCVTRTDGITVVSTGIISAPSNTVVVRPNPFSTGTQLVFTGPLTSQDRIALYDAQGRLLRTWTGSGTDQLWLPRGDLRSGVYAVHVLRGAERVAVVRVVAE